MYEMDLVWTRMLMSPPQTGLGLGRNSWCGCRSGDRGKWDLVFYRNVFAANASTQDLYTPNTTFDYQFGKYSLVHGISMGGAVVLVACLNSIR